MSPARCAAGWPCVRPACGAALRRPAGARRRRALTGPGAPCRRRAAYRRRPGASRRRASRRACARTSRPRALLAYVHARGGDARAALARRAGALRRRHLDRLLRGRPGLPLARHARPRGARGAAPPGRRPGSCWPRPAAARAAWCATWAGRSPGALPRRSEPSPMGQGLWCRAERQPRPAVGRRAGLGRRSALRRGPALRSRRAPSSRRWRGACRPTSMWLRDLRGKKTGVRRAAQGRGGHPLHAERAPGRDRPRAVRGGRAARPGARPRGRLGAACAKDG